MAFIDYVPHIIFILLLGLVTFLLYYNEIHYIGKQQFIREAEGAVTILEEAPAVDAALDGKLIYASAFADTKETLTDELYGVSEKALLLNRKVEYYQYKEHYRKGKGDREGYYYYRTDWYPYQIDSQQFEESGHNNFALVKIPQKPVYADVRFGGYRLPEFILGAIGGDVPAEVKLSGDKLQQWENVVANNIQVLRLPVSGGAPMVHVNGNVVYYGKSPSKPSVGDVRVTLTKIEPCQISFIAKVSGSTFEKYTDENGKIFSSVKRGTVTAVEMFSEAHADIMLWLWGLRLILLILSMLIWRAMFSVLPDIFKSAFLDRLIKAGFKAFRRVMGFVWACLVIGIAWIQYSSTVSIAALVLAVAGIWYLNGKGKKAEIENEKQKFKIGNS